MKTETFTFKGHGGVDLPAVLWLPDGETGAVLQITHGMTEHIGRYQKLAEELTSSGIAAAGFDLRGHGQNPGDPYCASFGENGWTASMEDMNLFGGLLRERFSGIPQFMLGFSLGSFLLREYLNRYSDPCAGAVILGTGHQPSGILSLMTAIVGTQVKKAGIDGTTPLVRKLSFETYNQRFAPNSTPYDWLCSDERELAEYAEDPLCRKSISAGLFRDLLCSMKRTGGGKAYENWNRQLPILLLSGEKDPVGDFGKGVLRVKSAMEKAGIADLTVKLFPDARHDLFHEEDTGAAEPARRILLEWILAKADKK